MVGKMRQGRRAVLAGGAGLVAMIVAGQAAHADALSDIRHAGRLRIAIDIGVPLFSYMDDNLQPTGSDVAIAKLIAKAMGVKPVFVQITNAARVPTIQAHKADILVANLAITPQRAEAVDFTIPYSTLGIVVAGVSSLAVRDYADLKGKRIGVTRATVDDVMVTQHAPGADIVRFEDDATLITAVVTGQVDLVSTQTAVLDDMNRKRSGNPLEVKFVQQQLDLGIALPKGEPALKAWLNGWIRQSFKSGELNATFKKFQHRDLPPDLLTRGS
jgi:polar amino acid transport system substrate-binding protein